MARALLDVRPMLLRFALLAGATLIACANSTERSEPLPEPGPRSGLTETAEVRVLSTAERDRLCAWWAETLGGVGRMQSCSECSGDSCIDWDVSVSTMVDCVNWLATISCGVTVEEAEDCAFALVPDLCASPPACDTLDPC
jgi:hypothetical protein